MERVDVLIVGGGPAGSSLAWALRGGGLRVCVMDRAQFPRDKTCAGWVTPPVWSALQIEPSEYAGGRTLQPIRGFQIRRMGDSPALARSEAIISHGIRRCEFDTFLLARCGAELWLGEGVRALEPAAHGWCVNGEVHTRLLVGAGGHFCPVARALSAGQPKEAPIAAQELELAVAPEETRALAVDPEVPEIQFTRDLAGYAWIFRKGDYLNVGLGRRGGAGLGAELRAFMRSRGMPEAWSGAVHGHAYHTYGSTRRPLARNRAALIGDAAGLAYPKSGEGIRPAVESGLLLARAICAVGDPGDARVLAAYERAMCARFGPRQPASDAQAPVPGWQAALAGRLFGVPAFARRVVVERWFLHAQSAPIS